MGDIKIISTNLASVAPLVGVSSCNRKVVGSILGQGTLQVQSPIWVWTILGPGPCGRQQSMFLSLPSSLSL